MALEPVSRRMLFTTMGAMAGAAVLGSRLAMAQAPPPSPMGPGTPPSTVTNPPRDFGPNGPPVTYVDPDVITIDPAFDRLRQGNTPLKRLWTGALWSEGPAWSGQGRYLVWSDIPNNRQLRWSEDNGRVSVFRMPSNNSNGNTFDFQGRQLSCEHLTRRVVRYEHDGSITIVADAFNGKRLNSPNDIVAHPDGSYWFTDPPYGGQLYEGTVDAPGGLTNAAGRIKHRLGQPPEVANLKRELPNSVYRVDPSGKIDMMVSEDQVPDPNGLVFSPDYKKLYVISTGRGPGDAHAGGNRDIHVFDVGSDNKLSNRKLFSDCMVDGIKCGPDGARCDVDGNVWVSSNGGRNLGYSGVTVWTPEGKLIGRIRLPEVCGNIAFGGPKRNRLFMAASQSLYALYVATQGAGPRRPLLRLLHTRRNMTMVKHPVASGAIFALVVSLLTLLGGGFVPARADETCQSPFLPKVTGQEDYIYVWTLGIKGVGDGNDSIVTVDVNPKSATYGKIIHRAPVPGQHEAHHAGFTDDRRFLWAGGLDDSQIFVFDVGADPARPKLVKTISTFVKDTGGLVGPHTFYALPGRMLISALSNAQDGSGRTGLAEYSNEGKFIRTIWMPKEAPYGYDVRVNANLNRMLTSSFTGKKNYMRPFGELTKDAEAMKQFGDSVVVWDFHARKPLQVLRVPGAPLELRWALLPNHNYAFTATALTGQLVLIYQQEDGTWASKNIAEIGANLPVDISIAPDDSKIYVNSFGDGSLRVYDVSNPFEGKLVETVKLGEMANMVSSSWDGKRLYATNSLLSKWDKPGDYWLKAFAWENGKLVPKFTTDFSGAGRAHIMNFGSKAFGPRPAARGATVNPRVSAYAAPR